LKTVARHSLVVRVAAGRVLASEGAPPREFLAVVSGHAGITRAGQPERMIGPGQWFGEVDLLARAVFSSTLTALSEIDVLVIERREFLTLLDSIPSFRNQIMKSLALKVRLDD
jgi:CRP-like cAMP-binding protein